MDYFDSYNFNNKYYRKKKSKKNSINFFLGLFVGILSIIAICAGVFFGIPSVKSGVANKLVNDSSVHNATVDENTTLKQDNQSKDSEIENLNNDKIQLNDLIEELNKDNENLSDDNKTLKNQNRDLLQQLAMIQGSNSCQITLENQYYSMTPDNGGHIWLTSNNENMNTYYIDMNNSFRGTLISNLKNETFSAIEFVSFYRIRVPELNIDQTIQMEKSIRNSDGSKVHINVVDVMGNKYENFDNFGSEFSFKLVIRDIDFDEISGNNYSLNLKSLDADIVVLNPNYAMQSVYRLGDETFVLNNENQVYIYGNYSGRYSRNGSVLQLNGSIDGVENVYLTSDNSILVGDKIFVANNAHQVSVDENCSKYVSIDPLMYVKEGDKVSFKVKNSLSGTVDTVSIVVGDTTTVLTPDSEKVFSFTMGDADVKITVTYKDLVFENMVYSANPNDSIIDLDLRDVVAGEYLIEETSDSYPEFNIIINSETKIQSLNMQLRARYNIHFEGSVSEFNNSFSSSAIENWIDKYSRARYIYCYDAPIRITLNRE